MVTPVTQQYPAWVAPLKLLLALAIAVAPALLEIIEKKYPEQKIEGDKE